MKILINHSLNNGLYNSIKKTVENFLYLFSQNLKMIVKRKEKRKRSQILRVRQKVKRKERKINIAVILMIHVINYYCLFIDL
jgi:hypothetical protein